MSEELEKREVLFDKIQRYYNESGSLTPSEEEICERWILAFSLLKQHKSKPNAIKRYLEIHKVSLNTAYQDFRNAELIFVPLDKISKDLQRLIMIEQIDTEIAKLQEKQQQENISESLYTNLQHEIGRLLATRVKATGIEHTDPNLPDFSKIQPPRFEINLPPGQIQLLKLFVKSGVVDISDFRNNIDDAQIVDND
jgi:hypothetical protein